MDKHKPGLAEALQTMLAPPGAGVYTVSHALSERDALSRLLYGNKDAKSIWQATLRELDSATAPWVLGIPEDAGGGIQRGANWGPLFLRLAYYQQTQYRKLTELGDVRVIPQLLLDDYVCPELLSSCRKHLYGDANASYPVSPLSIAFDTASHIYQTYPHAKLLGIGGDHAASYPLVKAKLIAAQAEGQRLAVLHIDAHTDLLTERMGIPITFGSWVPATLPYLTSPDLWIQLGIRQSSHDKTYWHQTFGIQQYWASEFKTQGAAAIAQAVLQHLTAQSVDGVYITVDIDGLDTSQVSATGTPETGGLLAAEVIEFILQVSANIPVVAADLMEFAPMVHLPNDTCQPEPQTTLAHILPIYDTLSKVLR